MTRNLGTPAVLGALACALALFVGAPAAAQSAQDFQLPPGTASPAPDVQGPVDPEAPLPQPRATAAPTPVPAPTQAEPPPAVPASPAARTPAAGTPTETSRAQQPGAATPQAQTQPPQPSAPGFRLDGPSTAPPTEFAPATAEAPPPPPAERALGPSPGLPWLWIGLAALAVALAGFALAARSRRRRIKTVQGKPAALQAVPEPDAEVPPSPPAELPRVPPPPARPAAGPVPLSVSLQATRLSATLLNATLQYRLTLINRGDVPLADVAVAADMIGAHAALGEAQLASNDTELIPRHTLPALAPGETAELSGEIRLPLAAIMPIRKGRAQLFVPLVRLRATAQRAGGGQVETGTTFVVGEPPAQPGGGLRPIRLDLGPRIYSRLDQREVLPLRPAA